MLSEWHSSNGYLAVLTEVNTVTDNFNSAEPRVAGEMMTVSRSKQQEEEAERRKSKATTSSQSNMQERRFSFFCTPAIIFYMISSVLHALHKPLTPHTSHRSHHSHLPTTTQPPQPHYNICTLVSLFFFPWLTQPFLNLRVTSARAASPPAISCSSTSETYTKRAAQTQIFPPMRPTSRSRRTSRYHHPVVPASARALDRAELRGGAIRRSGSASRCTRRGLACSPWKRSVAARKHSLSRPRRLCRISWDLFPPT